MQNGRFPPQSISLCIRIRKNRRACKPTHGHLAGPPPPPQWPTPTTSLVLRQDRCRGNNRFTTGRELSARPLLLLFHPKTKQKERKTERKKGRKEERDSFFFMHSSLSWCKREKDQQKERRIRSRHLALALLSSSSSSFSSPRCRKGIFFFFVFEREIDELPRGF